MAVNVKNCFPPLAVFSYTAVSADASADSVEFKYPGYVHGAMVQIRAADGTENVTGLDVAIVAGIPASTITVAATAIAVGDVINLIIW